MKVTFFFPPSGRQEVREITCVRAEDAEFFEKHGIKITVERCTGESIVYADTGKITDGEPDELIEFARSRSYEDTLSALRKACEERFAEEIRADLRRCSIAEELVGEQAELQWQDRQRTLGLGGAK